MKKMLLATIITAAASGLSHAHQAITKDEDAGGLDRQIHHC